MLHFIDSLMQSLKMTESKKKERNEDVDEIQKSSPLFTFLFFLFLFVLMLKANNNFIAQLEKPSTKQVPPHAIINF